MKIMRELRQQCQKAPTKGTKKPEEERSMLGSTTDGGDGSHSKSPIAHEQKPRTSRVRHNELVHQRRQTESKAIIRTKLKIIPNLAIMLE